MAVRRAAAATAAQLPPLGTTVKLGLVLVVLVVALMGVQRLLSDPATLQVGTAQGQGSRMAAVVRVGVQRRLSGPAILITSKY